MLKITYPLVPHIVCDLDHTCDHPRFPCGYGKHEILNDTNKQDRKIDLLVDLISSQHTDKEDWAPPLTTPLLLTSCTHTGSEVSKEIALPL